MNYRFTPHYLWIFKLENIFSTGRHDTVSVCQFACMYFRVYLGIDGTENLSELAVLEVGFRLTDGSDQF